MWHELTGRSRPSVTRQQPCALVIVRNCCCIWNVCPFRHPLQTMVTYRLPLPSHCVQQRAISILKASCGAYSEAGFTLQACTGFVQT